MSAGCQPDAVSLSWEPGGDPSDVIFYRVRNLTTDRDSATVNTSLRWAGGVEENRTYTFEVTAVNADGESPGSRVTATTLTLGPPTGLAAALAGDTVTLSWNRPAVDPAVLTRYVVRLSGVVETVHMAGGNQLTLSIPRVDPGRTHVYTVQVLKGVIAGLGPKSAPAPWVGPPAGIRAVDDAGNRSAVSPGADGCP